MKSAQPDPEDESLAQALCASRVLVDAPEALIQRAVQLFDPARRMAVADVPAPARLPRLLAALKFDSAGASPLAYGRRSGPQPGSGEVRQLLYALEDCDIDLRVAPADGGLFSLSGQLLGPVATGVVSIQPEGAGTAASRAALNEWGEFRLPPLPAGAWRVCLELPDRVIELPPLRVIDDGPALV